MMELNGSKYLTNEEMAVINAMRMGGKAQVNIFLQTQHRCETRILFRSEIRKRYNGSLYRQIKNRP